MRRFRTIAVALLVILAAAAAGLFAFRGQLAVFAMEKVMDRALAADAIAELPDGLHVGLCGAGSPMPDVHHAGPCTVVIAGKRMFLVDSGASGIRNVQLMNLPPGGVEAVFVTHLHSDHIDGLGETMLQHWAAGGATAPLPVYGPEGIDQTVSGFVQAYTPDRAFRIAHHGPQVVPPSGFGGTAHTIAMAPGAEEAVVIDEPDLKVTAFLVDHGPVHPAFGYRFTYKGRTVVITGDTSASPRVERAARNADVLVHEALAENLVKLQEDAAKRAGKTNLAHILHDIPNYHTTPQAAADIAQRAHVRYLLYTHVIPPVRFRALEGPFLGDSRKRFHGKIRVGIDGDFLTLPAGTTEIRHSNRMF